MKQLVMLSLAIVITLGSLSCDAQDNKKAAANAAVSNKVEVYYFHFTRRCMTCNAVEEESKKALETLYAEQFKNGTMTFTSVNLDEESSKAIAEKCNASGQALLVISGDKRIDLTSQGFMYARSNPEKLKEELKKAVENVMLKK